MTMLLSRGFSIALGCALGIASFAVVGRSRWHCLVITPRSARARSPASRPGPSWRFRFGTAWSSVIKGVGVVAGGPFWCAKADADDFMNGYTLPIMHATGSCMVGPPQDMDDYSPKPTPRRRLAISIR